MTVDPLAQAVMVAYCGWDPTVFVTNETVDLDGDGTAWAFLPCLNVTDVSAVQITNQDGSTYAATIGAGNDVAWSVNGVLTWQSAQNWGAFPNFPQSISVTYSGGYDGADVYLTAALNSLSGRLGSMGYTSASLGSAKLSYAASIAQGGLLLVEQMVFDRYRIMKAAGA